MKKLLAMLIAIALIGMVTGCAQEEDASLLKVGATPVPHAQMLELVKDDLEAQGFTLEIVEFTDYVTPNEAVESNEIHANFFQHIPYMESFNVDRGFSLVNAGGIHIEPIAIYSNTLNSLDSLEDGATVAIPNDPTNEGRALLLLQSAGLIELDAAAGITATPLDVVSNPKNLEFHEIDAASLPRVLVDVDIAIINGNYALPAGLSAAKDGLFVEGADSPYVNIVTVKEGMETDPRITALVSALQSEEIATFIEETFVNGEVVKAF